MLIREIFDVPIENNIDPVIKVGDRSSEERLASEIDSYVVTPHIEKYFDDLLEHYTDSIRNPSDEIGVWISGYFGSGKSHLAKTAALVLENASLLGVPAATRFKARIPADAPRRESIARSLSRLQQCHTEVIAFNLNTLQDSRTTPLARVLLSQYYQVRGYCSNIFYARVIESEIDRRGKLEQLHARISELTGRSWAEVGSNPTFHGQKLFQAACEIAPDAFADPAAVREALKRAETGELINVQAFVATILRDLEAREKKSGRPARLLLVMDEAGQWIEDDIGRLSHLQALVEESAQKGRGRLWVVVTTHEDMGTVLENASRIKTDMKKIEARFRHKFSLTTENIELVLKDRIFRKNEKGTRELAAAYGRNPGALRDLAELKQTAQQLAPCDAEAFATFYPFLPYQIHLVPEIVKNLRSSGGRGEQLSGSTRTLMGITQDVIRSGRRKYLDQAVGELVSLDEIYANLEVSEISADARRDIGRVEGAVPAATGLTRRVAESLYLIQQLSYVPRTKDNLARLLAERTDDSLSELVPRIEAELERLVSAQMAARIGEEYEFLTGERRSFEEEVAAETGSYKWQDLAEGLAAFAREDVVGLTDVSFKGKSFPLRVSLDGTPVTRQGSVRVEITSPLAADTQISDLEGRSLDPAERYTFFLLCPPAKSFEEQLRYYLGMRAVIDRWKGDPQKGTDARKLAADREGRDLEKIRQRVVAGLHEAVRAGRVVFQGASRPIYAKPGVPAFDVLREEISLHFPSIYPHYEACPVVVADEQKAIADVLRGGQPQSADVRALKLFDGSGHLNAQSRLLDAIRVELAKRSNEKKRILGKDLLDFFEEPPYGWDRGAVRVGVAALVRAGDVSLVIKKKAYANYRDPELQEALRVSHAFHQAELVLESTMVEDEVLRKVRAALIKLTGNRKIEETPSDLSEQADKLASDLCTRAEKVLFWARPAGLELPEAFGEAVEFFNKLKTLSHPHHRVKLLAGELERLDAHRLAILAADSFVAKWGAVYPKARELAQSLSGLRHRLPQQGASRRFLDALGQAGRERTTIQPEVWKTIENARAAAEVELLKLTADSRSEARSIAEAALASVEPAAKSRLPEAEALEELLRAEGADGLDLADLSLPERARQLASALQEAEALERHKPEPDRPEGGKVETVVVRLADAAGTRVVTDEGELDAVLARIRGEVSKNLKAGRMVELR